MFVCDNMAFSGDFEPVLAKHSKHFNLVEAISIGVDQMQRNFSATAAGVVQTEIREQERARRRPPNSFEKA